VSIQPGTHLGCDGAGNDVRVAVPADCQLSHLHTMRNRAVRLPFPVSIKLHDCADAICRRAGLQACSRSPQLCLLPSDAVRILCAELAAVCSGRDVRTSFIGNEMGRRLARYSARLAICFLHPADEG
jgi:hypothetical protein